MFMSTESLFCWKNCRKELYL